MTDEEDGVRKNGGPVKAGYRNPPAENRFKKGQSGNPHGRPKKPKVPRGQGVDLGTQPANMLLMEEAYRLVTIREGDRTTKLPAIQAVFRAMNVAAVKGNRFAQRNFAELVQTVENEDRKLRSDYLAASIEYKVEWERAIEQARVNGQPEPQPLPHPDDIIIDLNAARVHTNGPSTKEEKARWDHLLARSDEAQKIVTHSAERDRKARDPKLKAFYLEEWHFEQKMFDRINDSLPRRYQKKLANRSWAGGASRAGDWKKLWPGEM
jgi:Family of unknown function (DUF5681)